MRIPLVLKEEGIIFNASIRCESLRLWGTVPFLIDTGSPYTFLSKMDIQRLKVPEQVFTVKSYFQMAGSKYRLMVCSSELKITTKDETNTIQSFRKVGTIALPTTAIEVYAIPSIIGRDFLVENKLALYFEPHKNRAYLERE